MNNEYILHVFDMIKNGMDSIGIGTTRHVFLCRAAEPLASFRFLVGREEEKRKS